MTELIVALDVPDYEAAMDFVDSLAGTVTWFKVGLELFISDGAAMMNALTWHGDPRKRVMLDLKLHDIPETVKRAVQTAASLGAEMLTIHAGGGTKMMEAAVAGAKESKTDIKLLAVTALTSLDSDDMRQLGVSLSVQEYAARLANLASLSNVPGIVCSALEAASLRATFGDMTIVTPGIRPSGSAKADQKRVTTPAEAKAAGADFIVVGRPIRDVKPKDRPAAVRAILAELHG